MNATGTAVVIVSVTGEAIRLMVPVASQCGAIFAIMVRAVPIAIGIITIAVQGDSC
jgi:hypothetical protein